ncbi:putative disease resistance protein At3g14460 [Corylus avellana]|uniref:putative disease resistance protein At3g14460 n=1 Tax=Corylus avellana TaxID=13451 RepID=UPI00286B872E|nr:putative disease resistance protein At3g14460 [Corylus avellana]
MGGIGKTTLAQLAYNDNKVIEHFNLKVWVCVSDPFDVFVIIKTILEEIILSHGDVEVRNELRKELNDIKNLNQLQIKLKDALIGKKFLLVLDDVWESYPKWEALNNSFKSGAPGSKVIVTTRDYEAARVMRSKAIHRTMELPKEDCWKLFVKHAFHDSNSNAHAYLELEAIGRKIVKKCHGLPLAIKAIGALLWSKLDVDEWNKVLRSEIWDSPINATDILPALRLSYKYLSPPLRRCFAYCSIFPKDYVFKKDKLVFLWMAEGFLPQLQNKTMKEVGDDYFLALVSRSLFQQSKHDEYVMHDLISDLTKFISKEFTLCKEDDSSCKFLSTTRHFSYSYKTFGTKEFETFHKAKGLRTIVEINSWSYRTNFFSPNIRCLRVLILSHNSGLTELPNAIGKFKQLRYLNLTYNPIERLPNSICKLFNLQILDLSHCMALAALPRDVHKLINLSHLDITETMIMEMPIYLGKLKCLKTLPTFIVSKHSGSGIEELGKLTNLRGSLNILDLQNVEFPVDAKDVILRDKYLEKLELKWRVDTSASENHKIVLHCLEPHSILRSLSIYGYGGTSFPSWVGDASFSNITSLRLEDCKFCCSLPPLGQLPSLQHLSIVGLDGIVTVGCQFYGSGSSSMKPFGALEFLRFEKMLEWKEWFPFEAENEGGAFPNLRELQISGCPKLTGELPVHLPYLVQLSIEDCPQLVVPFPGASSRHKVMLSDCNTVILNESSIGIQELDIRKCSELELPMHLNYSSLECLTLEHCHSLKSFPLIFSKIRELSIMDCGDIESLTVGEQHEHDLLLSSMRIHWCPNFAYFPQGGLRAPNLKHFSIWECRSLRSLPDKMHILLPSLEKLKIINCPQVESFPEGGLPSNLNEISVENCDKLFANRMGWGLQNLSCVRSFSISDKSEDVESFPDEGLLPTSLTYLSIRGFPNLKSLEKKGFQNLTALKELMICLCPKLEFMPEDGLPASLSTIKISLCPLLTKELERKEAPEWRKIAHVPNKHIYY